ncbi:MAG TPA: serine/threonine-protein kinase, partial [Candidatus Sulfopaludibacter sp.]|nr:serine/threonine-protein kinase [Candidatus Sulfopaludibacter sp.]
GGMGEVFKAQDKRLNRFVAIKALPYARSGDPERRRRFVQEAQAASSLSHPNIITIHDIFQEGDTHFIVMEYVAGRTLLDLIPPTGMRVSQMLLYAAQMADALNAAHQAGIIHRDFKPANVMITASGLVKVLDFGLAKLMQPQSDWLSSGAAESETMLIGDQITHSSGPQTAEGSILGTVNYMSPEQAEGKRVDGRSDIFSLGAVLYEMATGRRAFQGDSDISTLSAVLRDEVAPISALTPEVPREVEDFINGCLRKDPNARWQTMKEVEMALTALKRRSDAGALSARYAAPSSVAKAPQSTASVAASAPGSISLNRILVLGAACVLLLLAAGTAWWWSRPGRHSAAQVAQQPPAASQPAPEQPAPTPAAPPDAGAPATPAASPAPVAAIPAASVPVPPPASKKDISALPPAPQECAPVVSPAPAKAAAPVVVAPPKPPARPDTPRVPAQLVTVSLGDGVPFRIVLAQDVTVLAQEHDPVIFRAADDVKAGSVVVIAKGATVTGEVASGNGKKFLGIGSKMTFKLDSAETVDGQKIPVRASV